MIVCTPPEEFTKDASRYKIFLAGSIEMGEAENWQADIIDQLDNELKCVVYNPRRDDWDASWEQSVENPNFVEQVNWELTAQEAADIIFMYLDPQTKSPISLLELGLFGNTRKLIVVCPEKFYRRGNVEITCKRYGIPMYDTLTAGVNHLSAVIKYG